MLSINPDAHETEGLRDMYYGVCTARKGGLQAENTFNAMDLEWVSTYLVDRKKAIFAQ
jgi:DNA polymerase (family 10)